MNELKTFENKEFGNIRTVIINNEPWFVGKDVATILGYSNPLKAIRNHVDEEDKGMNETVTPGGVQNLIVINESGLYSLIFSSKLESAKQFKHWVTSEVLPSIRKTGSYETPKKKQQMERLASVNNAVKILTPMLEKAGCNSKIQLLTAKSLYEKAGVILPIEIQSEQAYYDTVHIAREAGMYTRSGKPASDAVSKIIKRLELDESEYTETWEAKGNWQGTVRKYSQAVIERVKTWLVENDYPESIPYVMRNGLGANCHVVYRLGQVG